LACFSKGCLPLGNYFPKHPTEDVAVQFKVSVEIVIGKFSLEFRLLVVEISDDCIFFDVFSLMTAFGVDFLRRMNLIGILEPEFGSEILSNNKTVNCSRVISEKRISVTSFYSKVWKD